jgi:tRNA nucleotidyltransferase (CCA-adding enzyme)
MDGEAVLERTRRLPGGPELLDVAAAGPYEAELVGGAVRDILMGTAPRELDVVVAGDAQAFAAELARRLGEQPGEGAAGQPDAGAAQVDASYHDRFGTTLVRWSEGQIDIATRRVETYGRPGALPEVREGTPEEDLERRDFTVNAIAVVLAGQEAGRLRAVDHALDDLREGCLRVLHDQSFSDDPTRLLRLARYSARLGFQAEPHTARLAEQAVASGALQTVSGTRLGAEVRLALGEADPLGALAQMDRMSILRAWRPGVCFDEHLVGTALEIMPPDGDRRLLIVASMLLELMAHMDREETEPAIWDFLCDLELPSGQAQRAFSAGIAASCAGRDLQGSETTEELLELVDGAAVEGLALAGAIGDMRWGPHSYTRRVVEDWLTKHRHIQLQITGDDLIAAGLPEGPEIGRRLDKVFAMRMTGLLEEGREAELCAALADDE